MALETHAIPISLTFDPIRGRICSQIPCDTLRQPLVQEERDAKGDKVGVGTATR